MEFFIPKTDKKGFESILTRSKSLKISIFLKQYDQKPHGPYHQ